MSRQDTKCVHGNRDRYDQTGAISVPIYQSATFAHPGVGESVGYDYSRLQNPTREQLEILVRNLEGGFDAMAFSSGMAATSTLMELFSPGDHLIVSDDIYGGSHRLFNNVSMKNGLEFTFINTSDLPLVRASVRDNTKAIFTETPTNPLMQVTDLRGVSQIARENGCLLIVDNTFLTPYFQKPIELGADIVMHSGTKFLGGHNDTLAGLLVVNSQELSDKLRFIYKTTGAVLSPFDSWLIIRGIKTLHLRMERQEKSALEIASYLDSHPKIRKVYYAGLPSHPQYGISKSQSSGFGSMISMEVDSEETARSVLERIKVIYYAESLGGVESLMTYPMLQTHGDIPKDIRDAKGINERLLRLSVGVEDVRDLIEDLSQALA